MRAQWWGPDRIAAWESMCADGTVLSLEGRAYLAELLRRTERIKAARRARA